jgi:Ca-activated chloride channel family protein
MTAEQVVAQGATATQSTEEESQQPGLPEEELLERLPEGEYPSSVIVILSDGEDTQSIDPVEAAQAAAERNVRIDALGFGTTAGTILELDGFIVHTALDEAALQKITQAADGRYYAAQGEQDPKAVYADLAPQLVVKSEMMEITALFAGASILVLLVGSLFSMLWFNRLV